MKENENKIEPTYVKILDDGKKTKMEFWISFIQIVIPIVISALALFVSVISLRNSSQNEIAETNRESYFEPLNYDIKFDEGYLPTILEQTENSVLINSPSFSIVPETGGINQVDVIYYYDDICFAILKLDLSKEVPHDEYKASNLATKISGFTDYAYVLASSSSAFKNKGYKQSYYTTLYVAVKDYDNNCYINPIVLEYPVDDNGKLSEEYNYRIYEDMDLLYGFNSNYEPLPDYDLKMLKDYKSLREKIDNIM